MGGLCQGIPPGGYSLLGSLDSPINADVPVLGVTWGYRVSDPFPFLVMPCPSYSGIASGAPPPWLLWGLSLSHLGHSTHTLGLDRYFSLPLRCPHALSCFHPYAYFLLIPLPVVMCWLGVFYSLLQVVLNGPLG